VHGLKRRNVTAPSAYCGPLDPVHA